jgi:hypothetical protein
MKVLRTFKFTDARLLEHAEVVEAILPGDLPDFTAFDATITGDYVTQLQQAIDAAKAISPDYVVIDEMAEETQKVEKAMDDSYEDYKTLAFFVRKAFKGNPAVQNQFGKNDVQKARKSQPRMVVFMESLAKTAEKYSAELVAAGCSQALIDGLPARVVALHDSNIVQEKFKKDRGLTTQDRVQLLNQVYELLKPIHEISTIIYADNPQKLKNYRMPQPPKYSGDTADETADDGTEPPAPEEG